MKERQPPCSDCKNRLCEHYLNEDGECIQPNTIAQLTHLNDPMVALNLGLLADVSAGIITIEEANKIKEESTKEQND